MGYSSSSVCACHHMCVLACLLAQIDLILLTAKMQGLHVTCHREV